MGFWSGLLNKKQSESVVLIDIGADSVAGAYARFAQGELPALLYTRRIPIEVRGSEPRAPAMLRALRMLGDALLHDGAPILVREAGSGNVSQILVSINAPWQKTWVRTEDFEKKTPFAFSRAMVQAALKKSGEAPAGQALVDETVIGTILNGYETRDPYGKQAQRASVVILSSFIEELVGESIRDELRRLYHTNTIAFMAGVSLRYQAMRFAFPHERDALIVDATGLLASVSLVRKNLLVEVIETATRSQNTKAWLKEITAEFTRLAEKFPLPRTIFLLAQEPEIAPLREALSAANLEKHWLSDNPPNTIPVLVNHLSNLVRSAATSAPDLSLFLMALYYQYCARIA